MKAITLITFFGLLAFAYAQQRDDCLDCVRDIVDALDYCKVNVKLRLQNRVISLPYLLKHNALPIRSRSWIEDALLLSYIFKVYYKRLSENGPKRYKARLIHIWLNTVHLCRAKIPCQLWNVWKNTCKQFLTARFVSVKSLISLAVDMDFVIQIWNKTTDF